MAIAKTVKKSAHALPIDLKEALAAEPAAQKAWQSLTPLARNEFICWVENAKQEKTRQRRIQRTCEELIEGKRRPCCWMGCPHRTDKPMNPTQKWIISKQSNSKHK